MTRRPNPDALERALMLCSAAQGATITCRAEILSTLRGMLNSIDTIELVMRRASDADWYERALREIADADTGKDPVKLARNAIADENVWRPTYPEE